LPAFSRLPFVKITEPNCAVRVPPLPIMAGPVMISIGGSPSTLIVPLSTRPPVFNCPPIMSRVAPGLTVKKLMVVLGRSKVAVPVWMITESNGEFGAEPLFQLASEIGQAPVPFQIKTVDGSSVGSFDVVVLVFGSSPPITGMSGLELGGS